MSGARLRFGLVGAGRIAQSYAMALADCQYAALSAVADVRAEAGRAFAAAWGCRRYDSCEAMLDADQLDALIVCTPPVSHTSLCLAALERGLHVFCEKPLGIDVGDARTVRDAVEGGHLKLAVASKYRFVDDVVAAKRIVNDGLLGPVLLIENCFASHVDMRARWNSNPRVSGGGVLIDNGTHALDLVSHFIGPISWVFAAEGARSQGLPVEETVHLLARGRDGALGTVDLSWSFDTRQETYLRIYGELGTLLVGWRSSRYRIHAANDWVAFGRGYDKIRAVRDQLEEFARAVRGEGPLTITADDGVAAAELVEAGYGSLQQGRWAPVAQAPQRQPA